MTRKLIVNADDFGRTRGVSLGIIRAHLDGIVTSTTAMMNMPGVTHDLQQARDEAPKLGLGVHLNFTAGRPLMPPDWVPSLIDGRGHFLSQSVILSNPARIDREELKSELKAQIAAFKNVLGEWPDHLDAHHFTHLHAQLFEVYLELAEEYDLPVRIPFPRDESQWAALPRLLGDLPREQAEPIVQAALNVLARRSIRTTDHCSLRFFGPEATLDYLLRLLDELPQGVTELMTHPGLADDQLKSESAYNVQRDSELAALTNPQVLMRVYHAGIDLITFAALK